jgi:LysM repeat protein
MKILKFCAIMTAAHLFILTLIFASGGCSSTNKATPVASTPEPATPPPVIAVASAGGDAPLITPAPISGGETASAHLVGFDPNAPAVASSARYSPTRPGTPAATAVQAQPVADVLPATTYTVASGDSLWTLAKKNHLTVAELVAANNLKADAKLKPGQKLIIPAKAAGATAAGMPAAAATAAADGTTVYKVKAGDKLSVIARRAGTTTAALKELNALKSDTVRAGQELKLPAGAVMHEAASSPADAALPAAKPSGDSVTYTVKPGETLSAIAKKFEVRSGDIAKENNITDPAKVRAGMTLVIPGWKAPKSAKPAAKPAATTAAAPVSKVPAPDQDLDAGLKPATAVEIPVIKIEDAPVSPATKP